MKREDNQQHCQYLHYFIHNKNSTFIQDIYTKLSYLAKIPCYLITNKNLSTESYLNFKTKDNSNVQNLLKMF